MDAKALASHYPELSLRIEPAHREASVALPNDTIAGRPGWGLGRAVAAAGEALQAWAEDGGYQT